MKEEILFIDNMVCYRCILIVKRLLEAENWNIVNIELGRVQAFPPKEDYSLQILSHKLENVGLRLRLDGYNLIARIKGIIVNYVYDDLATTDIPLSEIIIREVKLSYSYVSRHFSSSEQRTIEEFYQLHRLERAKRLLFQTNANIKSIAKRLKYKSAGHFSASFRKLTGETPSEFRNRGTYQAQSIDKI